jgi:hypothetical protein
VEPSGDSSALHRLQEATIFYVGLEMVVMDGRGEKFGPQCRFCAKALPITKRARGEPITSALAIKHINLQI